MGEEVADPLSPSLLHHRRERLAVVESVGVDAVSGRSHQVGTCGVDDRVEVSIPILEGEDMPGTVGAGGVVVVGERGVNKPRGHGCHIR